MSGIPSYQQLQGQQGQTCVLRCFASGRDDEPELSAVLAEVGKRLVQSGYERFSLLFHVDDSGTPKQGIYAVTLPGLQVQEWFLVPVGRNGDTVIYEACFNRNDADAAVPS